MDTSIGGIMGSVAAAAVGIQQAQAQNNFALSVLKQNAKTEEALVQMIANATGGRGQNLDVTA